MFDRIRASGANSNANCMICDTGDIDTHVICRFCKDHACLGCIQDCLDNGCSTCPSCDRMTIIDDFIPFRDNSSQVNNNNNNSNNVSNNSSNNSSNANDGNNENKDNGSHHDSDDDVLLNAMVPSQEVLHFSDANNYYIKRGSKILIANKQGDIISSLKYTV